MWQVVNRTPYAVERCFVRDRHGAEVWVVAVKGTFAIRPDGTVEPAAEQAPVHAIPEYWGEPGQSSLRYEADLTPPKPGTDVLLHGHAYAPGDRPVPQIDVSLEIGPLRKTLRVTGDRAWRSGLTGVTPSAPQPFLRMPIRYERAFGGVDRSTESPEFERRNPVGVGLTAAAGRPLGQPLPNIEDPRAAIASPSERPPPAGFGPIPAGWSPRIELAGTYDARWDAERRPLPPVDMDERHHQCAPPDQQVPGHLREGTAVTLTHLSAGGYLRFTLPAVRPVFRTSVGRSVVRHQARLHTVIIEPDDSRVLLVWHTALPCHGIEHRIEKTVVEQKSYHRILDER
ncbi:DUF2169 domain-containing protein [Sorangium sp. So ce429]